MLSRILAAGGGRAHHQLRADDRLLARHPRARPRPLPRRPGGLPRIARRGRLPLGGDEVIDRAGILAWLRETDPSRLSRLYRRADAVRRDRVGDEVHLRGLVEISNHCVRRCAYCGIAATNDALPRYRMTKDEVLSCAEMAQRLGYGTVVLQAGEDYGLTRGWVADVVRAIRSLDRPRRDAQPRRAARRGPRRVARSGRRPVPPPLRDVGPRALRSDPPFHSGPQVRPLRDPRATLRPRLRGRAAASWSASRARPSRASPPTSSSSATWTST